MRPRGKGSVREKARDKVAYRATVTAVRTAVVMADNAWPGRAAAVRVFG